MNKLWKFFEYGYLVIAIFFGVETILKWNIDRNRAYILLFFTILAIFMYFFRKHYRKKFENRNK